MCFYLNAPYRHRLLDRRSLTKYLFPDPYLSSDLDTAILVRNSRWQDVICKLYELFWAVAYS